MVVIINVCAYLVFFALLAYAVVIDIKKRIIPNWVIFGTIFIWLSWKATLLALGAETEFLEEGVAALIMFAALLLFTAISERIAKKYLFGGGDIKLVSASALFLGIYGTMIALFFACAMSLFYAMAKLPNGIPFAPCILCGSLIALMM